MPPGSSGRRRSPACVGTTVGDRGDRHYRQELARSHNNLGVLHNDLDKGSKAEEHFRRALGLQEKLAADFPAVAAYCQDLAGTHNNLGIALGSLL